MLDVIFQILLIISIYYIVEGVIDFIMARHLHIIYPLWKNINFKRKNKCQNI